MNRLFILLTLAWASLMPLLGGCHRIPPLSPQEQATVNTLTSNLKPRCVGRYLIDMPADAKIFGWLTIQDVKIEAKAMSLDEYHQAMRARSVELSHMKSHFGYRFLYDDNVIQGIPESRYFVSLKEIYADADSDRFIEAYRWDHGYQIKMTIMGNDAQHSTTFKDDPSARDSPGMNDFPEKLQLVFSLMRHAHGRADDEIPTSSGVCFLGGLIDGVQYDKENPSAQFVMPGHDDVDFVLETNTTLHVGDSDTLLSTGQSMNVFLQAPSLNTLRHGEVKLPGMIDAQEVLLKVTTGYYIPGYLFMLAANQQYNNRNRPIVMLNLSVGDPNAGTPDYATPPEKASLTESESVALWDAVSRTLRPRPGAF